MIYSHSIIYDIFVLILINGVIMSFIHYNIIGVTHVVLL